MLPLLWQGTVMVSGSGRVEYRWVRRCGNSRGLHLETGKRPRDQIMPSVEWLVSSQLQVFEMKMEGGSSSCPEMGAAEI